MKKTLIPALLASSILVLFAGGDPPDTAPPIRAQLPMGEPDGVRVPPEQLKSATTPLRATDLLQIHQDHGGGASVTRKSTVGDLHHGATNAAQANAAATFLSLTNTNTFATGIIVSSTNSSKSYADGKFAPLAGATFTGPITAPSATIGSVVVTNTLTASNISATASITLPNGVGSDGQSIKKVGASLAWAQDEANLGGTPGLYFNGATTSTRVYSTLTGQTIGTNDVSLRVKFKVPSANPSANQGLIALSSSSATGAAAYCAGGYLLNTGVFHWLIYGASSIDHRNAVINSNLVANYGGQTVEMVFTRTGSTVAIYLNGQSVSFTEISYGTAPEWSGQVDSTYLLVGVHNDVQRFAGPIYAASVFNLALSAADVLDIYRNSIPSKYQWGAAAETITKQTNRDFSVDVGDWTGTRCTTTHDAVNSELEVAVTDSSSSPYAFLPIAQFSRGLSVGKTYRFTYTMRNLSLTAGGSISVATGGPSEGLKFSLTNGTHVHVNTLTKTGVSGLIYLFNSCAVGDSFSLDDVSVVQVGAIVDLDFEHANPAMSATIADRSNNALHGTIFGGISQTRWIPQLNVGTLLATNIQAFGSMAHGLAVGGTATLGATNEIYLVNANAQTVTLPTAVGLQGRIYTIKTISPAETCTVTNATGAQNIDGALSYSLTASNKFVRVISSNTNWWVIGSN